MMLLDGEIGHRRRGEKTRGATVQMWVVDERTGRRRDTFAAVEQTG